jgi:hypothetical protein
VRMMEPPSFKRCKPFCTVNNSPFTVKVLFRDVREGNEFADAGVGENNFDSPLRLLTVW